MTVTSNVVVVTVAGTTAPPQTVDVTFVTMAGATVTVAGKSGKANSSGEITFTLAQDTSYSALGKLFETVGTCEDEYAGSTAFTTGTSAETVEIHLVLIAHICA